MSASRLKKEFHSILSAVLFFTRIPLPKKTEVRDDAVEKGIKYFSLIGILIGSIGALVFYAAHIVLPIPIAVLLSMITTIYTTGALHEDGMADVCDGFGGGWDKDRIMQIMKDSAIGVFGAIGMISILALKYTVLISVPSDRIVITIIAGHSLSRFTASLLVYTHPYVGNKVTGKAAIMTSSTGIWLIITNAFFGVLPLFFFEDKRVLLLIIPMILTKLYLGSKFRKWIGGYTGDCAGATQQISEVIFYLSILVLWNII